MDIIQLTVGSIARWTLAALGSWIAVHSGYEFVNGDAGSLTILELVTGLVLVGITFLLKKLDGTKYGALGTLVIGPRAASISHSIARILIAVISSGLAAFIDLGALDTLEPGLGDESAVSVVVLCVGFLLDRVLKKRTPQTPS